jgi:hypothetical protein
MTGQIVPFTPTAHRRDHGPARGHPVPSADDTDVREPVASQPTPGPAATAVRLPGRPRSTPERRACRHVPEV